jgi:hypothetical protein
MALYEIYCTEQYNTAHHITAPEEVGGEARGLIVLQRLHHRQVELFFFFLLLLLLLLLLLPLQVCAFITTYAIRLNCINPTFHYTASS